MYTVYILRKIVLGMFLFVTISDALAQQIQMETIQERMRSLTEGPQAVAFNPDGDKIAVIINHTVALIDASIGQKLWTASLENPKIAVSPLAGLLFSSDGTKIFGAGLSATAGPLFLIIDAVNGRLIQSFGNATRVSNLQITKDGRFLVAETGSEVTVWDIRSGLELRSIRGGMEYSVFGSHLLEDQRSIARLRFPVKNGAMIFGPGITPAIEIWDLPTGEIIRTVSLDSDQQPDQMKTVRAGNKLLVTYSLGNNIAVVDIETGKITKMYRSSGQSGDRWLQVSDNGQFLVTVGKFGGVYFWNLETGKESVVPDIPPQLLDYRVALNKNGDRIAFIKDNSIGLYDVKIEKVIAWFTL